MTGFLIFAVFFGCFLFGEKTQAEIVYTYDLDALPSDEHTYGISNLVQQIQFYSDGYLTTLMLNWEHAEVGPGAKTVRFVDETTDTVWSFTNTASSSGEYIYFTTTTPIFIDQTHNFEISPYTGTATGYGSHSSSSTYNNAYEYDQMCGRASVPNGAITSCFDYDLFVLAQTIAGYDTDIQFASTPDESCDFWSPKLNYMLSESDWTTLSENETNGIFMTTVGYSTNPSYFEYVSQDLQNTALVSANFWNYSDYGLKDTAFEAGQTIYAQAFICDIADYDLCDFSFDQNTDHILKAGQTWTFTVPTEGCPTDGSRFDNPGGYIPTATSTNAGDNITCDTVDGFFANSMCNLFQYLLKPSQASLNNFSDLKDKISAKPPFGYFTIYKNALSGVTSATTTTSTINTTTSTLSFYRLSSLDFFDDLRDIIKWLLWITFIIYLFNRFKKFIL